MKKTKLLLFVISILIYNSALKAKLFEGFEYKTRKELLKAWDSKNFFPAKTLNKNPFYYYEAQPKERENKAMCVALRTKPIGIKIPKNFKPYGKNSSIRAIQIYKKTPQELRNIGKIIDGGKEILLSWEWNTIVPPLGADDFKKQDNSFALYIVLDAGFYSVKYIKYTWSPNLNIKKGYNSKLSNGTRFVFVRRTAKDKNNIWFKEKVNITKDIKKLFPKRYKKFKFVAIAILSDSDDAKKPILACIDNIEYKILKAK